VAPAAPKKKGPKDEGKKEPVKAEKKPSAKGPAREDQDAVQVYGVTKEEEKPDNQPRITYAPDTSVRDLRGPAQARVIPPTNQLTLVAAIGFVGWLALLVTILVMTLFPTEVETKEAKEDRERQEAMGKAPKKEPPGMLMFFGINLARLGTYPKWQFGVYFLLPIVLGMGYSALMANGAVRTQHLESRNWGIAASVMCMIPIHSFGVIVLAACFFGFLVRMFLDDEGLVTMFIYFVMGALTAAGVGVGVMGLKAMMSPEVIAGFQYKPEM
jgi:hypothetical protein